MYISKMFRRLINWEDDIILLSEDIKFLEEFLYIQKYRFEDEFEYRVMVDEAAKNCLLPKLIIATDRSAASIFGGNQLIITVTPVSMRAAITVVASVPILFVYPFLQKYFVKGVTIGAVKG